MLPATSPKRVGQVKRADSRITGIVDLAKQLGVERTHLYRVIKGKRSSNRLLQRYHSLIAQRAEATR